MRTMLIGAVMLLACPIITLIAGGWCASVSCADDKGDKTSEQAKAICEKFNKALFAKDVDAAMKLVATPWFDNYVEKGEGAIRKDAAEVKKHLEEQVKTIGKEDMKGEVGLKIIDNLTYEEMPTKVGDKLKPEEKKMLDAVLKKTDRIPFPTTGRIHSPVNEREKIVLYMFRVRTTRAALIAMLPSGTRTCSTK